MSDYNFREATIADIPFLVKSIIEAERSGTDKLSYTTIFGLTDDESYKYIAEMLSEEIDGCELSVSSFYVAESDGQVVAAVCAWIEGLDGIASSVLKGNLLSYTLPKKCLERAASVFPVIRDLQLDYSPNTIIVGNGYVLNNFRGHNLLGLLISERISYFAKSNPEITEAFAHVFQCNTPSLRTCEKLGFKPILIKKSDNEDIMQYLPYHSKVLLKKEL